MATAFFSGSTEVHIYHFIVIQISPRRAGVWRRARKKETNKGIKAITTAAPFNEDLLNVVTLTYSLREMLLHVWLMTDLCSFNCACTRHHSHPRRLRRRRRRRCRRRRQKQQPTETWLAICLINYNQSTYFHHVFFPELLAASCFVDCGFCFNCRSRFQLILIHTWQNANEIRAHNYYVNCIELHARTHSTR